VGGVGRGELGIRSRELGTEIRNKELKMARNKKALIPVLQFERKCF
jgi:hypothetical protein